jgi:hypothetical protein
MDGSLWSAGRHTHLKIVVVSLIASTVVVAIGMNTRLDCGTADGRIKSTDGVIKAGQPKAYTDNGQANIR